MFPVLTIVQAALALWRGPLSKILETHVADQELRARLSAEIEASLAQQLGKGFEAQANVVMSEIRSDHWLTRSWRPLLMLLFMALLVLYGVVLPAFDLIAAHPVKFTPRWRDLPPELWNLLTVGLGGYVGGRSLEKIVDGVASVRIKAERKGLLSRS
jgi:hypothetical protein